MAGKIRDLVDTNANAIAQGIERFSSMAASIDGVVSENRADIRQAVAALPQAVANARDAAGEVQAMVSENREGVAATVDGLAKFAPRLDRIGEDVETITDQVARGEGTIGKLVMDDELHDKAVRTIDSVEQRLDEVKPFTSGISQLKFYIGVTGGIDTDDKSGTATGYLRIEPKPWKFYEAGAGYRSAPEDRDTVDEDPDDLNVDLHFLLGWRFFASDEDQLYRLSVAGGLIESALGGRIDIKPWNDRLTVWALARGRHDDYAPDERRFEDGDAAMVRAGVEFRVWRRVSILAGVHDVLEDPDPWVGLRAEILDNDVRNLTTAAGIMP
jgi:phospholipid/cholesterol/gamma-HCH transport system substrate-binding protein